MSKARANADATSQTYIENATAAQDLSGTYSTERLYFNDSYQLTGDVTVTGHLALGSIADEDVVITQDGTERTITGSGTLESGNVLQDTHRTSLTDMTGTVGSVVTNNAGVASGSIGSGVTFPAGHVVQVISGHRRIEASTSSTTWVSIHSSLELEITPSSASHKIFIMFSVPAYINTTSTYHAHTIYRNNTNLGGGGGTGGYGFGQIFGADSADSMGVNNGNYLDSPNTTSSTRYKIYHRVSAGIGYSMMNNTSASITIMEIVA